MIEEIAKQIQKKINGYRPETLIILGSGLGTMADEIINPIIIPYKDIKGFPVSTATGHKGQLIVGRLEGKDVICMQGRFHIFEGYAPQTINTVIKAFQVLGIKNLIVTNASGSLNKNIPANSIMLITDHINFPDINPLVGPNDEKYGPRFPSQNDSYTAKFQEKLKKVAQKNKIKIYEGVYIMVSGPTFETKAEAKAFAILGADAVGMSTIPEVISATHSGMKILGLSCVTNMGAGLQSHAPSHKETLLSGKIVAVELTILIKGFLKEL